MKKIVALLLALTLSLSCLSALAEGMYISVISKGEQHAYWQAVRKGCEDAAAAYGVEMYYYGPASESDIAPQVEALKAEMAKSPAALCLAALSTDAVMGELQQCVDNKIPVIGFDSGVPDAPAGAIYATAATNNYNAAGLAAEKMMEVPAFVEQLKNATADKPVVIGVLSQDATSASITGRTSGFVDRMAELASAYGVVAVEGHELWTAPAQGASIIIHVEVSATTLATDVANSAMAILNKKNVCALFCSNEGAVTGLLAATADGSEFAAGGAFEKIMVAGFDAGAPQKNAVRNGWFIGSVTQDPYRIGYLSVELAVKAANGEAVADVDTGAQWYNAQNIDTPEISLLVYD